MLTNNMQLPAPNGGKLISNSSGNYAFTLLAAASNVKGAWLLAASLSIQNGSGVAIGLAGAQPVSDMSQISMPVLFTAGNSQGAVTVKLESPIFVPAGNGIYGYAPAGGGIATATWALLS